MTLRLRSILACAILALAAGCLTTAPAVQPTGDKLDVKLTYKKHGAYIDDDLNYHGAGTWETFHGFFQGSEQIDELDFYAIGKDERSVAGIVAWREAYNTNFMISSAISGAGLLMLAGGLSWYGIGLMNDPEQGLSGSPQSLGAGALTLGGMTVMGLGIYAWSAQLFGPKEFLTNTDGNDHLYSFDRAIKLQDSYNASLGAGADAAPAPADAP